jgi:hypothetical protein
MSPVSIGNLFESNGRTLNPQIDPQMFLYFDARVSLARAYGHQQRAASSRPEEQTEELLAARDYINKSLVSFERIRLQDESNFWNGLHEERDHFLEASLRGAEIDLDLFRAENYHHIDFASVEQRARLASQHLVNPPHAPNLNLLRAWLVLAKCRIFQGDNAGGSAYLRLIIEATNPPNLSPIFVAMRGEAGTWQMYIGERPEVGIPPIPPQHGTPHPPIVSFAIYPAISGGM